MRYKWKERGKRGVKVMNKYEFFVEMGKENIKKDIFVSRLIQSELKWKKMIQNLELKIRKDVANVQGNDKKSRSTRESLQ